MIEICFTHVPGIFLVFHVDVQQEAKDLEAKLEESLRPNGVVNPVKVLPQEGRTAEDILNQLQEFVKLEEPKWRDGNVSGGIYSGESELIALMGQATTLYGITNPLHPDIFPSLMKFEVGSVLILLIHACTVTHISHSHCSRLYAACRLRSAQWLLIWSMEEMTGL